ncbi:bile acid:sodium symporter [Novosphingobium sp. MW5]|nr:bile acid:sodium symporter [Novosphingobium sp. MW5]
MDQIDDVMLNFSPASLTLLNAILAVVMFAIALDLRPAQFRALAAAPRPVIAGFLSQFGAAGGDLSLGAGHAAAPVDCLGADRGCGLSGGNISNFLTHRAGGNAALSVSLTAIATLGAIALTPLNIALWGGLYAPTREIPHATTIDPVQVAVTVLFLLVLPLALGMLLNGYKPALAARLRKPMQILSMVIFLAFILAALAGNWAYFVALAGLVAGLVIAHNALALSLGYGIATLARVAPADRRAITIETGIQEFGSGADPDLRLFGGLGGMAVVAAFWGLWHAISGLALALAWARRPL